MSRFHNKTRTSTSIPEKLRQERKYYLLPAYYLLRMSVLAREGIERSGSYHFADHIYADQAQGTSFIGKLLDRLLLNLPSARSFRARYLHAKKELHLFIGGIDHDEPIHILAVPSGLARECFEVADELFHATHPRYAQVRWHGLDLDADLIAQLRHQSAGLPHPMSFWSGDAFDMSAYDDGKTYDMIISMGFTEFLSDEDVIRFYRIVLRKLKPGGVFFTTGMQSHRLSEYLMQQFAELRTHYRTDSDLRRLADAAGFQSLRTVQDDLQTLLIATAQ